jgi:FlaG/FlaF family flagellin (archaellin)
MKEESNNGGVSPVIGVILMVSISVILATIIGTFVLGMGNQIEQESSPSSKVLVIEEDRRVFNEDNLEVGEEPFFSEDDVGEYARVEFKHSGTFKAKFRGDGILIDTNKYDVDSGERIRVQPVKDGEAVDREFDILIISPVEES